MAFVSYFAGRNAYRYVWLFMATVVIFADTGSAVEEAVLLITISAARVQSRRSL